MPDSSTFQLLLYPKIAPDLILFWDLQCTSLLWYAALSVCPVFLVKSVGVQSMWDCAESLILLADLRLGYFFCLKWTCCCNIKISMKKKKKYCVAVWWWLAFCIWPSVLPLAKWWTPDSHWVFLALLFLYWGPPCMKNVDTIHSVSPAMIPVVAVQTDFLFKEPKLPDFRCSRQLWEYHVVYVAVMKCTMVNKSYLQIKFLICCAWKPDT